MNETEDKLVKVTDQIAQVGLMPFTQGNRSMLVRLRDELTEILQQAEQ